MEIEKATERPNIDISMCSVFSSCCNFLQKNPTAIIG